MISAGEGLLPIGGVPVGLITWFGADGPVAVLTSWLAVINGSPPELRAGCSGLSGTRASLPLDLDFAVNVPDTGQLAGLHQMMQGAACGFPVPIGTLSGLHPARSVHAPLLTGCALQIECAQGRLASGEWEPELAGDIVLLHRGGLFIDPADHHDFCALRPLRAFFPS